MRRAWAAWARIRRRSASGARKAERSLPLRFLGEFARLGLQRFRNDRTPKASFSCSCCGKVHDGPPMAWHLDAPRIWVEIPEADRQQRGELTSDRCIVDHEHFFIRGLVELPVVDGEGPFSWGAWVSVSKENFQRARSLWDRPDRVDEPAYFGWLSNSLPGYPETLNLKTNVHTREVGLRPYIELEPTDHPLALEQRDGITLARVKEIGEMVYHRNSSPRGR